MTTIDTLTPALHWYAAGAMPIPVKADGTKAPGVRSWKQWQDTRSDAATVVDIFTGADSDGLGVLTGATSGNLEMLEAEGRAVDDDILPMIEAAFARHNMIDLWDTVNAGYVEITPSGGVHWYYRITDGAVTGNTKLARRPATPEELAANPHDRIKVLIETRGQGGFSVVAPSTGRSHPTGKPWRAITGTPATIPTITVEQRDAIHAILSTLDEMPDQAATPSTPRQTQDGLRPGDDYNARTSWTEILEPRGWKASRHFGGTLTGWTRPGKDARLGISATTGKDEHDRLYVFTSSTEFEPETPYSKFGAYALLEHGGDHSAAASALRAAGFGTQQERPQLARLPSDRPPIAEPTVTFTTIDELTGEVVDAETPFWETREILAHVRQFALARMTSPWSVLGVVLLRTLACVPPWITLPPVIGGPGSLNAFVALVGPSGVGKGATEAAAQDAVIQPDDVYTASVGSGEGIAHQYAHRTRQGVERDRDSVLFTVPEVDTLTALGNRQGATLMSQLRSAFSGERLGFGYADATRRIPIERHSYRLGMTIGVQPERAAALLDDADGGTPQRIVWMPATSAEISDTPPSAPAPVRIERILWGEVIALDKDTWQRHIPIPDEVAGEIRAQHAARARGEGNALDGHAMFAREKVAVALAVLDGRWAVTVDDWALAGVVMDVSDRTRESIKNTLTMSAERAERARSDRDARRQVLIEDKTREAAVSRVCRAILRRLPTSGPVSWSELRRRMTSDDRRWFEDAIATLRDGQRISITDVGNGRMVEAVDDER